MGLYSVPIMGIMRGILGAWTIAHMDCSQNYGPLWVKDYTSNYGKPPR